MYPKLGMRLFAALAVVCLAGCGTVGSPSATGSPSTDAAAVGAARAELDRALERLSGVHPEPFHAVARATFEAELEALKDDLATMTRDEAMVGLMRLWARLSTERDGHQFAFLAEGVDEPTLPLRVYEFAEGVFITAAMEPHADLVGARITAVGGHPIDEVLDALEPLVPRDGPATVPAFRPIYLLKVAVLRGLGLVGPGDVSLHVADETGTRQVAVATVPVAEFEAWAGWLAYTGLPIRDGLRATEQRDNEFWVERLPTGGIYVRYTAVRDVSQQQVEEMEALAAAHPDEPIILDLRHNPGGDNHNYPPILSALDDPDIDREGRLFVLTDRVTFSAASQFATEVERRTSAIFVGEQMGGGLNFWDDVTWVTLDDYVVPMRVAISVRYWVKADGGDTRLTIDPELTVPTTAEDYFAGRDAVLEATLELAGVSSD
ncbi:MAG TPA: hypothetical protein VFH90_03455 [Candidatus Limnocylindria bacterium]|nr:hypothetical protein [Candidatus Limnocylindria bacterium]